jgi:4-hydroxy-3-methylbut-2-enyl diphosphate reductase IspH
MNIGIALTACVSVLVLSIWATQRLRESQIEKEHKAEIIKITKEMSEANTETAKEFDRALSLVLTEVLHREGSIFLESADKLLRQAEAVREQRKLKEKVTATLADMLPGKGDAMVVTGGTPVPEDLVNKVLERMKEKTIPMPTQTEAKGGPQ